MRTKHDSDAAFEDWVDGAEQLRTHSVQAAFRQGWDSGQGTAAADLARVQGENADLKAELNWERHQARCGQCGSNGARPRCPDGTRLRDALAALAPPTAQDAEG